MVRLPSRLIGDERSSFVFFFCFVCLLFFFAFAATDTAVRRRFPLASLTHIASAAVGLLLSADARDAREDARDAVDGEFSPVERSAASARWCRKRQKCRHGHVVLRTDADFQRCPRCSERCQPFLGSLFWPYGPLHGSLSSIQSVSATIRVLSDARDALRDALRDAKDDLPGSKRCSMVFWGLCVVPIFHFQAFKRCQRCSERCRALSTMPSVLGRVFKDARDARKDSRGHLRCPLLVSRLSRDARDASRDDRRRLTLIKNVTNARRDARDSGPFRMLSSDIRDEITADVRGTSVSSEMPAMSEMVVDVKRWPTFSKGILEMLQKIAGTTYDAKCSFSGFKGCQRCSERCSERWSTQFFVPPRRPRCRGGCRCSKMPTVSCSVPKRFQRCCC